MNLASGFRLRTSDLGPGLDKINHVGTAAIGCPWSKTPEP